MKTKMPVGMGSMPKGSSGSGRKLDHPNCGASMSAPNNNKMDAGCPMGGKAPKSMGGGERKAYKNPSVKAFASGKFGKQAGGF